HCLHSRGRTGVVVLSNFLREYLRNTIFQHHIRGIEKDIEINIPQIIYEFRKQRFEFLTRPGQLKNVYSLTSKYIDQLRKTIELIENLFFKKNTNIIIEYLL